MANSTAGSDDEAVFMLYRYDPSMAAAVIFILLFLAITAFHVYKIVVTKTWFFTCFVIGGIMQVVGYIGRAISASESPDWTLMPYIMQNLLLLVSPALFAASIYMILSRIILVTDGEQYSPIRRSWLTKTFVIGDVLSFMLQGGGGGLMASGGIETLHTGEKIIIFGLVVQVIFFSLFAVTAALFHRRFSATISARVNASSIPWQRYLMVLYIAAALVMVRSVFRLIEYAQGNAGALISKEIYLYIFDGILMFLTMLLFAFEHPGSLNALLEQRPPVGKYGFQLDSVA
ncbi:hypothetical protein ACHAQA_005811 [Verticillium albo-atrum]